MAPMITDSYHNYNELEFVNKTTNQSNKYYNASNNTNKPPLPVSMSYAMGDHQQHQQAQMNGFNFGLAGNDLNGSKKRVYSDETIIEIFKGFDI